MNQDNSILSLVPQAILASVRDGAYVIDAGKQWQICEFNAPQQA